MKTPGTWPLRVPVMGLLLAVLVGCVPGLAALAHERGLSVALKNDLDQIPALVDDFDFALNEECARYGECARYAPFIHAGKAVLHVEYEGYPDFCAEMPEGLSSLSKPPELDAERSAC